MNVVFSDPKPERYTNLLDPNKVDINPFIPNGIPQYQDMHIFAELTAIRKARTVLYKLGDSAVYRDKITGMEETIRVNLLGNDQTKSIVIRDGEMKDKIVGNPNYLHFTTNYYQGSTGTETQYEGFGISDIKIVINSSFVPQVNIQFVDIRGVALFNQENSPYRIIFDFPPPIFELTIKGYYGRPLTYKLHLVKYTSEFRSDNGNFVVDAQFVALTYAPLTDVLFKYAINFPLMRRNLKNRDDSSSSAPETAPKNIDDFLTKLKALMPLVAKHRDESAEADKYNTAVKKIEDNDNALMKISAFREELAGEPYLLLVDNSPEVVNSMESRVSVLNNITEYNDYILQQGTDGEPTGNEEIPKRIYIAYYVGQKTDSTKTSSANYKTNKDTSSKNLDDYRSKLIKYLNSYKGSLKFDDKSDITTSELIQDSFDVTSGTKLTNGIKAHYVGIDITKLYYKLQKNKSHLLENKYESASAINEGINNIIFKNLGMMPTIYNIFKIIMDDVDVFFETIRQTSIKAENEHHNTPTNYRIIVGDGRGDYHDSLKVKRVFAFPLIINEQGQVCGGSRQERIAPIELSNRTEQPFPEIELINEFIDTFLPKDGSEKLPYLKNEEDEVGNKLWIPISPIDSSVASYGVASPYLNVERISSNEDTYDGLSEILKIVLERFYILSQGILSQSFYGPDERTRKMNIQLYSQSEAINLAVSIVNQQKRKLLKEFATEMIKELSKGEAEAAGSFYDFLKKSKTLGELYQSNDNLSFSLSPYDDVYVDKNNIGFRGVHIIPDSVKISLHIENQADEIETDVEIPDDEKSKEKKEKKKKKNKTKTDNPIQQFMIDAEERRFTDLFERQVRGFFTFTQDNILYIEDTFRYFKGTDVKENMEYTADNLCLNTRYLVDCENIFDRAGGDIIKTQKRTIDEEKCNELLSIGNAGLLGNRNVGNVKKLENMVDIWVKELSLYDKTIHEAITNGSERFSALMLLSNFGYTLGPFNESPKNLRHWIFSNPAIIEVPRYLPAYIGALIGADTDTEFINELKEFFIHGEGKNLTNNGLYIFADIYDVNHFLSENDKELFRGKYDDFINDGHPDFNYYQLKTFFNEMFETISENIKKDTRRQKKLEYTELLNPKKTKNGATYFNAIIEPMLERVRLANYTELTFTRSSGTTTGNKTYNSLAYTNSNVSKYGVSMQSINNSYFTQFFSKLKETIDVKEEEIEKEEEKFRRLKSDDNIITQMYYSFKNINDKWLTNPISTKTYGYPFNKDGKRLIDSFVFVDRAMNPIGDTVINPEPLLEMAEDPNISVFSVIAQLLSANGFEFFPLQNFMSFERNEWEDCFRISNAPLATNDQTFVCMLIGGSSSYPSNTDNDFVDDGVIDLESGAPTDFNTTECNRSIDDRIDNQVNRNPDFPWRQVRAFRVRFGEQNQSMFKEMKIDSKEFPETNESINILSRLAGDGGPGAPVPQGQNLFNIYENRAYSATVGGLGNAMIQPTQYFQLENVPMFNGAYLILTVEHNITQNKMTTTFSGTKILRFPYPRVTNPAAIYGLKDGYIGDMSAGGYISTFGGSRDLEDKAKLVSMYDLKIE